MRELAEGYARHRHVGTDHVIRFGPHEVVYRDRCLAYPASASETDDNRTKKAAVAVIKALIVVFSFSVKGYPYSVID